MPQLTKNQFIVLAIIIIAITIFIVVSILNSKEDIENINQNNNESNGQTVNVSNNDIPNISNNDIEHENNDNEENNNGQEVLNEEETNINTQPDDPILTKIQSRLEVVTDKNSNLIFENMFTPTKQEIESFIGVDLSKVDSYLVRMEQSKFSSKLYMILKPFEEDKEDAKMHIKKFLLAYESAWNKLDQEQYNLILNRTAVERNGYIIYIISTDNDTIMHEIRKFI